MGKIKPKIYFSKEILISQIDKIMHNFDLNQSEFNEKIGVAQAITKWKSGQTPSAESLLAIKKIFGISIDQLLTGEEPHPILQEFASEYYEARSLESIETILLFEVLEKVEEVVIKKRQKLSMRQTARLVSLVYDHCCREREKPSQHLVEKYLLLAD
jgi:transcriptional regulator with XRE-family HTH domain